MRTFHLFLFALLLGTNNGFAQNVIDHRFIVKSVLEYTHAHTHLQQFQRSLFVRFDAFKDGMNRDHQHLMRKVIEEEYDPKKLFADLLSYCISRLTDQQLMAALRWYESPVGSKIARQEKQPEFNKEYKQFEQEEVEKYRHHRRLLLLNRLSSHLGTEDLWVETSSQHFLTLLRSIDANPAGSMAESPSVPRRRFEKDRAGFEDQQRKSIAIRTLFTYRHVTNNELQDYNQFFESSDGSWISSLLIEGVTNALEKALQRAEAKIINPPNPTK